MNLIIIKANSIKDKVRQAWPSVLCHYDQITILMGITLALRLLSNNSYDETRAFDLLNTE